MTFRSGELEFSVSVGYDAVSLDIRFSKSGGSIGSKCPNLFLEVSSLGDEDTAFPRNVRKRMLNDAA